MLEAGKVLSRSALVPPSVFWVIGQVGTEHLAPFVPELSVLRLTKHAFSTRVPLASLGVTRTPFHACVGRWTAWQSLWHLCPLAVPLAPLSPSPGWQWSVLKGRCL